MNYLLVLALSFAAHSVQHAAATPIQAPEGTTVTITFNLPSLDPSYNTIQIEPSTYSHMAQLRTHVQLFDEVGPLGEWTGTELFFPAFSAESEFGVLRTIDFTRLADGATGARLQIDILDSPIDGALSFDTDNLRAFAYFVTNQQISFGDPINDIVFTNVSVSPTTRTVPLPAALSLVLLGLGILSTSRSIGRAE